MRCPMGYHINDRTSEVHRPGCSHHAKVYCHPLPECINSLRKAVSYTREWIDSDAVPCFYCRRVDSLLRLLRRLRR